MEDNSENVNKEIFKDILKEDVVSISVITLLLYFLLLPFFGALFISFISYVLYASTNISSYRLRKEIKIEVKRKRRHFEKLKDSYKKKIRDADTKKEKYKIAEKFKKDLEKEITDLAEHIVDKYGVKDIDKNNLRKNVRNAMHRYLRDYENIIKRYARNSSNQVLSSADYAHLVTADEREYKRNFTA